MTNASARDLAHFLANGLGRARVILERGANTSQRRALIRACLRDDRLVGEESRADWLYGLVQLVDLKERLAAALADPFADSRGDDDTLQRFELIGRLARDGVPGMRESLYRGQQRLVDQWLTDPDELGPSTTPAKHIIALDGMPGAVLAFGELGRAVLTGRPFSVHGELIEAARSGMAAAQADAVLAEARASDPRVEAFLQAAEAPRAPHVHDLPEGWHAFGWVDFQKVIERRVREGDRIPFFVGRWGERAPELELAKAAEALVDLPKGDVGLLRGYLGVFNKRPFPLDPAPLVALVGDRRRFVAGFAIGALKRVSHPAVRELALRMAARGPHRASSLGLLAHNWERGDEEFAEGLLRSTARHRQAIHTLCYGLRDVVEARPSAPELVPAIRLAYEVQPCSICREDIVSALLSLGALPDDLRAECRWDAHEGTRRLVSPET